MRAAHHATSSLMFARAVLPRNEPQVTGDVTGALEPTGQVERRDKRTRGDRTDPGSRRESLDRRIPGNERLTLVIGIDQLVIDDVDEAAQRRERRLHRRRQLERGEPGEKRFSPTAANAQAGGPRDSSCQ
jgi:hypothetical protein